MVDQRLRAAEIETEDHELNYRIILPDGRIKHMHDVVYTVVDDGKVIERYGVVMDVTERKRAEARLTVQYETARALAEAETLAQAVPRVLRAVCESLGWEHSVFWQVDKAVRLLRWVESWHPPSLDFTGLDEIQRQITFAPGAGLAGAVWSTGLPSWVPDITPLSGYAKIVAGYGLLTAASFPVIAAGYVLGVIQLFRRENVERDEQVLELLMTIGGQIGPLIERQRAEDEKRRAEEALRASQGRYRLLFERNLAGAFRATMDGCILDCNDAVAYYLGYDSPKDLLACVTDIHYSAEEREAFLARLRAEKCILNSELRLQRRDGTLVWVIANASVVDDEGTELIEATIIDITDRKESEEALVEGANLEALRAEIGVALTRGGTLDAALQSCTEALARRAGAALARVWTLNETSATLLLEASAGLYTHLDGAHGRVPLGKFKIGRIAQNRTPHLSNDIQNDAEVSDPEWVKREGLTSFVGVPLVVEKRVVGVVAMFGRKPITDEVLWTFSSIADQMAQFVYGKRAEEAQRRSEERARLLFATIPHPAWVCDVETLGFLEVNEAAVKQYGYSREEFLRLKVTDITRVEDVERLKKYLGDHSTLTVRNAGQWGHRTRDGRPIDVEISAHLLEYDGRKASVAIAQNVTEQTRLELELRHAQKLEAVGGLAAGIAHELNTPIQYVGDNTHFLQDAFADLGQVIGKYRRLRDAAVNGGVTAAALQEVIQAEQSADLGYLMEEIPKALVQSLDGVTRVATIVRAMKEFAHPDRSEKMATDLNKALESTLTVARNEIKYVADVETDFEELPLVFCYGSDMNQVFLNLLVNSAHAIKDVVKDSQGKGVIRVRTHLEDNSVLISISDTGCGIPENIREKIFEPFFTTKDVGHGSGQGLAIARSIVVEKHGGSLTFDTEVGRGTSFYIRLPIDVQ